MERKNITRRQSYHFDDNATTLPLNLQLAKGMRVVQQDACCILGVMFRGKGGEMGKRNTENL